MTQLDNGDTFDTFNKKDFLIVQKSILPSTRFTEAAHGITRLTDLKKLQVCPDGITRLTEAAHGTVTRHYREHQKGNKTSTNPIASIFAWTRGLSWRAKLDGNERLEEYCQALEEACVECVLMGQMSKDLAICAYGMEGASEEGAYLHSEELLDAFAARLKLKLSKPLKPKYKIDMKKGIAETSVYMDEQSQ